MEQSHVAMAHAASTSDTVTSDNQINKAMIDKTTLNVFNLCLGVLERDLER